MAENCSNDFLRGTSWQWLALIEAEGPEAEVEFIVRKDFNYDYLRFVSCSTKDVRSKEKFRYFHGRL